MKTLLMVLAVVLMLAAPGSAQTQPQTWQVPAGGQVVKFILVKGGLTLTIPGADAVKIPPEDVTRFRSTAGTVAMGEPGIVMTVTGRPANGAPQINMGVAAGGGATLSVLWGQPIYADGHMSQNHATVNLSKAELTQLRSTLESINAVY